MILPYEFSQLNFKGYSSLPETREARSEILWMCWM